MIDLKSVVEKYPECLDSATKFKSYMMDLYPDNSNKARIRILADIVDCGIALEIKNGKTDSISIFNFCNTMESQYGYSAKLVEECVNQFVVAFSYNLKTTEKGIGITTIFEKISSNFNSNENEKKQLIACFVSIIQKRIEDKTSVLEKTSSNFNSNKNEKKQLIACLGSIISKKTEDKAVVEKDDNACNANDFEVENGVLKKYCGKDNNITIPNYIKRIDDNAFRDNNNLIRVDIANGVTDIGKGAFYGCSNLEIITLPNSLTRIEECAFQKCSKIENISIPNSVELLDAGAFMYCTNLKSINLPSKIKEVYCFSFTGCTNLTSVQLSKSTTKIGAHAFCKCVNLKNIDIPNSVFEIGLAAFEGCTALEKIVIPSKVTVIKHATFLNCTHLKSVTIPTGVTSIRSGHENKGGAFKNCKSIKYLRIPDSVVEIEDKVFENCDSLILTSSLSSIAKKYANENKIKFQEDENSKKERLQKEEQERLYKELFDKEQTYQNAISIKNNAQTDIEYENAINIFNTFPKYKDSNTYIKECHYKILNYRKSKKLCLYCGSQFSGFIFKKCSNCGKLKDY